jgi:glycosyltransferase involved in cell wall biosynthesis
VNILFVDQFSTPGGAQQCLRDLIPAVVERGWTAHVGLPRGGPLGAQLGARGALLHEIPLTQYTNGGKTAGDMARFALETPRVAAAIRRIIREHDIHLVYVNGPRVLPAVSLASSRILFHAHSRLDFAPARLLAAGALSLRGAPVIAASEFVASALPAGRRCESCGRCQVQVIYNGVTDHGFGANVEPMPATNMSATKRIGMVGRIAPEKGQSNFVRAARLLLEHVPDAEFMICGEPLHSASAYSDQVRRLARGLPITFHDWQDDIGPLLRQLDVLAVPSLAVESTPRIIPEAFSAGVPVVAYASGGIPELIEHGATGLLTSTPTPEALAAGIRELLSNHRRRASIRINARRAYEARFTLPMFQANILDAITRVAEEHFERSETLDKPRRSHARP